MIKQPEIEKLKTLADLLSPPLSEYIRSAIYQLEWRDMDSAPKNITQIDVLIKGNPTPYVVVFYFSPIYKCWIDEDGDHWPSISEEFLCWRPRPEPPKGV